MSDAVVGGDAGAVVAPTGVEGGGDAPDTSAPQTETVADWEALARDIVAKDGPADGDGSAEEAPRPEPAKKQPKKVTTQEELDAEFERLTGGFSKLTSEERRLKKRAAEHTENLRKFDAERQSFQGEREAFAKEKEDWHATIGRAKLNPEEALKLGGWTIDDYARYILDDGKISPEKLLKDYKEETNKELETIRREREEARRQFENEQLEHKRTAFVKNVRSYVEANLEQYPYLATQPMDEDIMPGVLRYIDSEYRKGNVVAPDAAMSYFEQRLSSMAARFRTTSATPTSDGAVQSAKPAAAKPGNPSAPLTNRDASLRSHRQVEETDDDEMDDAERIKRAVAALG